MSNIKGLLFTFLAGTALSAAAQNPQGMSQEQLEQMMQGMNQMASCFQSIDQERLETMSREAEAKQAELKQLCADGQRDQAQQEAMAYGMKMMESEEFKQLQKCGEMAGAMMPEMDYSVYQTDGEGESRHVCDDL